LSAPAYTPYHPKWYRRPVSVWWWLESWRYTKFVLRELTSIPVGLVAAVTLWQVMALAEGPGAYEIFLARMQSPLWILIHILALGGVLFHALTWFHLAPKAMVMRIGGKRVADSVIVALNYLTWMGASAVVAWLWLGR
jgi:fumarate reductase subunit C